MIRARLAALAVALALPLGSCGLEAQHRPDVVSTFPASDQVLAGWIAEMKVTYDEEVHVLNEDAVRLAAEVPEGTLDIPVQCFDDPTDDHSILIRPVGDGFFLPQGHHHLVVQEGAASNLDGHYRLQEYSTWFTVGSAPNLLLASSDGNVYEVARLTAANVSTTTPPAGTKVKRIVGADGQAYAWIDPVAGNSLLGRFVPGAATISTFVTLTGETGTRTSAHLAMSTDGRTVYATARDSATNRLYVHRIVAATGVEIPPALVLSQPLAGAEPVFQFGVDGQRQRLYVPFSDGATGGFLAFVDIANWVEIDAGPLAGVDALPVPAGAGACAYEHFLDAIWMLCNASTTAAFVTINPEDLRIFPVVEPTIVGKPTALFPSPDGNLAVQGLVGYAGLEGLCVTDAHDTGDGFPFDVSDDVLGVPQGSLNTRVLLRDPALTNLWVFADNGTSTVLATYNWFDDEFIQLDADLLTPGIQSLPLAASAPGVIVSATTLSGQVPP